MFKGSFTALVTPFRNGIIDEEAFQRFIGWQIDEGTEGLVPCGTTGESATMTPDEQTRVIELCVKTVRGRVPVIAGTGTNDTAKTIHLTQTAQKLGADAALLVTPYYNKPSQEGLFQHYKAVHDATRIPLVLYNVPGRTGVNLTPETVGRLAELPRIAGIKDATPDIVRPLKLRQAAGPDFALLSGEDASVVAFLAHGGDGCISVTANIAPRACASLHRAWARKDWAEVCRLRDFLLPLHEAMFIETNPCPVKFAASMLGFGDGSLRLPLWQISDASREIVRRAMESAGIREA
ncbi:MAG: 4-hydroxy-tetrahydrodipicolinate synthase [Alphaproteobacteria bacterium]|jgi:4-hydroxy-tetrahydrodipicolinate synthase